MLYVRCFFQVNKEKQDQCSRSSAAEPEKTSLAGLWLARSCLCPLQTQLAALTAALLLLTSDGKEPGFRLSMATHWSASSKFNGMLQRK